MSKSVLATVFAVCLLGMLPVASASAQDEPIWTEDGLVYPEGAQIPAWLTEIEREYLERHPRVGDLRSTEPPTGPIYCVPEYDPMEGILLAWESYTTLLIKMARAITTTGDADIYLVVDNSSEQNSAYSTLSSNGVDMNRVQFVVRGTDTVWIRDYGPRYIYEGDCRAIIDHEYNRPRPNDNAFNSYFSTYKNHAYYEIPLEHGGGNYHLDEHGYGYTSRLICNENPELTEAEIHDLWLQYQNCDTLFFDPFPSSVDSTQHIDMWLMVISGDTVIISDWPTASGSTQDQICDNAAADFTARGYTVYRTPACNVSWTHYTYTNATICNDLLLIPYYTHSSVEQYNEEALVAYHAAAPDKVIVQLDCESIIGAAGAMHCICMHVPEPVGGEIPTAYLKNYRGGEVLEPDTAITVNWISDDNIEVTSVDLLLSTDGGSSFPTEIVAGTADDGEYTWTVPDIYTTQARIRVVVHDGDANSGYDESDSDLTINGCPADLNDDGSVSLADLAQLLASYGLCEGETGYDPAADLDGDDCVNIADLAALLSAYGIVCP